MKSNETMARLARDAEMWSPAFAWEACAGVERNAFSVVLRAVPRKWE